jgi:hypothetical protein
MEGRKTEKDDEEKKFYRFPEDELEDNIDNLE